MDLGPLTAQRARAGFTLVEVALAVAVGLIILAGAVTGYNAVKDNASSAFARRKVNIGAGVVMEYAAANFGRFPTSVSGATGGEFSSIWAKKLPDEYNVSPWGGQPSGATDGCIELDPISDGTPDPTTAPDKTALLTTDGAQAANVIYVSFPNASYAKVQQLSNPDATLIRGFCLSIYDRVGQPWFHLATNNCGIL